MHQAGPTPPLVVRPASNFFSAKVIVWYDGSVQNANSLNWQKSCRDALKNKISKTGISYEEHNVTDANPSVKNGGLSEKALYEQKVPKFQIYLDNLSEGQVLGQLECGTFDGKKVVLSGPELFSGFTKPEIQGDFLMGPIVAFAKLPVAVQPPPPQLAVQPPVNQ